MTELGITDDQFMESKEKLRTDVTKKVELAAYDYLIKKAKDHSKVRHETYQNCDGADYFFDSRFTSEMANLLFKFRTRTFLVKNNFRNNFRNTNTLCPLCGTHNDSQEHIFDCREIFNVLKKEAVHKHDDIFSSNLDVLHGVTLTLMELVKIRGNLITPE